MFGAYFEKSVGEREKIGDAERRIRLRLQREITARECLQEICLLQGLRRGNVRQKDCPKR